MTDSYAIVADALTEICSIDPADIAPDKHILDDLGVDSLDFLDVTFEIDRKLGVKLPIEEWMAGTDAEGGRDRLTVAGLAQLVERTQAEKAAA